MFFICDFFDFFFIEVPPPSIFTKNETFCDCKGLVKGFGTMRLQKNLPVTFKKFFEHILEKFRKIFSFNFLFFSGFPLRKIVFLLFSVGEEWFSRLMPIPSGIFWRCNVGSTYDIAYLVFKSSQVFAKHGFASVSNFYLRVDYVGLWQKFLSILISKMFHQL